MKILLINNGVKTKDFYDSILSAFADSDNIIEVRSVPEAKDFIANNLINTEGRIDLIVTNFAFGTGEPSAIELIVWLRGKQELSYYDSSLRLPSLPIVLAKTDVNSTDTDGLLGFDRIIKYSDLDNEKRVNNVIFSSIRSWVNSLMNDYELLKVDPIKPFLFMPIIWNSRCNVLARGYAMYPRRLPFIVFRRDIEVAEASIEDFYKTVQRISKSSKPKQEKAYHALLKKYPDFILGETYDKFFL